MPIQIHQQHTAFELLIWEVKESIDFFLSALELNDDELALAQQKYTHSSALLDWASSRYALQTLFQQPMRAFQRNAKGKLFLPHQSDHLSISHSGTYAGVVRATVPVGIDIQIPTPKLARIATKYIDAARLEQLRAHRHYDDYLHIYWGIKEALFKAYGEGALQYIEHLHIESFDWQDEGRLIAKIEKPNFKASYQVVYQKTANYYLCIVTKL